tara:strand:+ start:231 stop:569 length:339 start_codon:yes stop_codon:yes gene_type:complete
MQLDNNTKFDINIKWLVQIIGITITAAWGYFTITTDLTELKMDVIRMNDQVGMNSEFRTKWPLGQLGSLPDDAEQNLRLKYVEKDLNKLSLTVDDLKTKSIEAEVKQKFKNP